MAENDLIHDRNINKKDYTTVGAYVTASYADTFRKYSQISKKYGKQSVVGVNHYGGLRASILKGGGDKASRRECVTLPRTFACVPFLR